MLLAGWGASLAALDSVEARSMGRGDDPAACGRPSRSPTTGSNDGETGVDAVVALRRRFGPALPVIVVTGSTMSGHEAKRRRTTSTC